MRSLCLMMVLVTGAMTLHQGASDELDKRLVGGLIGGSGGLVGGLIGGEGGLLGSHIGREGGLLRSLIAGEEGGILGNLIGEEDRIASSVAEVGDILGDLLNSGGGVVEDLGDLAVLLIRLEEGAFKGVLYTALELAGDLLESFLGVLATLTKGLAGKTTIPEFYAEFKKIELESLCPACSALLNAEQSEACDQYCQENGWSFK